MKSHVKFLKLFLGAAPPNPLFLLDFELITNFVIIFTILAAEMKSLTFSKAFVLTLTIFKSIILSKTIYWHVCVAVCQKPAAGADFGGCFS